jgi:anaerobic dimethyl sulfoxide reductase subunit B (iron-sulfur subunit)
MTYAFTFDARFCSGCKACQAACKDKNNLPLGVLWRRVYEVAGGSWQKAGEAWNNTVFAYNLSVACNHCIHPKCAGICPTNAYSVREGGIVILDTSKCMGCGYCAWACPYGAPQYNAEAGYMTKCNFCFDNLEQGLPPACVSACPMRVLDYGEPATEHLADRVALWDAPPEEHPYPLPYYSHTQPRVSIRPHAAMNVTETKFVANLEEIQPHVPSRWEDVPLILFTLFTQLAVGGFWAMLWTLPQTWASPPQNTGFSHLHPLLVIGVCLGIGLLASLAHLGTKKKVFFALRNLRRSWLSREVLFTGLFGIGWLCAALARLIGQRGTTAWMALTASLGLGLVYSMAQVYRLRAVPAWNTWLTNAGFMVSALLLGQTVMMTLLSYGSKAIYSIVLILLLGQLALIGKQFPRSPLHTIRSGFILIGVMVSAMGLLFINLDVTWLHLLITLIVLIEEGIGRWLFYRSRV